MPEATTPVTLPHDDPPSLSGLLLAPPQPHAALVLAHGAGADMHHVFLHEVAHGLAERNIATLRYQFPSTERGGRRPDRPPVAHAAVRSAVRFAAEALPGVPLFAGGKSFGARMTSQAQAARPLPGVQGLVFIGFPLHAPGQPSADRADHLSGVSLPMLFVQGTQDKLADLPTLRPVLRRLAPLATLMTLADADHGFHVPRRSGRDDAAVMHELLDDIAVWTSAWRIRPRRP